MSTELDQPQSDERVNVVLTRLYERAISRALEAEAKEKDPVAAGSIGGPDHAAQPEQPDPSRQL